jgi:predicted porin
MRRPIQLLGAAASLMLAVNAQAADLPTTKDAPSSPVPNGAASCASVTDFVKTDCPLSWYGVTIYGALDLGVGWESHGTPFNNSIISGVEELVQKNSNRPLWLATPGGLTQSFIGIKAKEEFTHDWFIVGDLTFGFDPYSMTPADGPNSYFQNNGVPLANQTSNADSSRAGQFYNGVGDAGISNATFGTLTFGRQNSLTLDGVIAYDPMNTSYAFSVLGWSGLTAGAGDTEDARITTAVKYRVDVGVFRAAAFAQLGGYDCNNGAQGVWEVQAGGDFGLGPYGKLSVDAIYTQDKGAVSSAPLTAAQNLKYPGTLAATISDNSSVMLLAKFVFQRIKISGGYERIEFQNPSDPQLMNFTNIAGITVVAADINNNAYPNPRIQHVFWIGGRYAFTDAVDAGTAYYHYYQQSYFKTYCDTTAHPQCAGTLDAVSFDVDWKFASRFDVYAGLMFSEVHNGLASGYLNSTNLAPTAGLRMRF